MSSAISKPLSSADLLTFLKTQSADIWLKPNKKKVYEDSLTESINAIGSNLSTIMTDNQAQFISVKEKLVKIKEDLKNLNDEKSAERMQTLNGRINDLASSLIVSTPVAPSNSSVLYDLDNEEGELLTMDEFERKSQNSTPVQGMNSQNEEKSKAASSQPQTASTTATAASALSAEEMAIRQIIEDINTDKIDNITTRVASLGLTPGNKKDSIYDPWARALIKNKKFAEANGVIAQITDVHLREARDRDLVAQFSKNEAKSKESESKAKEEAKPVAVEKKKDTSPKTTAAQPTASNVDPIKDSLMGKASKPNGTTAISISSAATVKPTATTAAAPTTDSFEESFKKYQASLEESFLQACKEDVIAGLQPLLKMLTNVENPKK